MGYSLTHLTGGMHEQKDRLLNEVNPHKGEPMNNHFRIMWIYEIHAKVQELHQSFQVTCPNCAHFLEKTSFSRETMSNCFWGLCNEHLEIIRQFLAESEGYHFDLERDLGVYTEGFFRNLPDGRLCSIRTNIWRDYLLSLCEPS